ncbi:MAG: glycosyl transferase [Parcubacteria group bacterium CG10_big_fil_rev_8_21_14_0_10_36_14]|nr:MAG: glycosyl transferase [Parcubacteria group bacterium CG10_big_fil_rev_8_21_14_0_10_36_14]
MKIIIVVPCFNEDTVLEKNIKDILQAITNFSYDFKIVISDNNSKDKTAEIGNMLAEKFEVIDYIFVPEQGKGVAVMDAWKRYDADIYGFMDADLATDLGALDLVLKEMNNYDIIIGSRRINGAKVKREFYRKITSRALNFLIRLFLHSKIKDTACGFKFFHKRVIREILPKVRDRHWTFDTELLILSERVGFKIKEIPVKWEEKKARVSRVVPLPTIVGYLKKIFELRK